MLRVGMRAKSSTLFAAAKAAVVLIPREFTAPWTPRIPSCTVACWMAETEPYWSVLRRTEISKTNHAFPRFRTGTWLLIYSIHSRQEKASLRTVAAAAPFTPRWNTTIRRRSPPMFVRALIARKMRGVFPSPSACIVEER